MLKINERKSITGHSMVGETPVFRYTAEINSANPDDMSISYLQLDAAAYEANRVECRADQAEFEDHVYAAKAAMKGE